MPITALNNGPNDHIPEDFTLESLKASTLSEEEIAALTEGDDPITNNDPIPAQPEQADEPEATPPPAAAAPAPVQQQPVQVPDTSAAEAIVAKLDADLEALAAKYDDGELTMAEFRAQQRAIVQQQAQAQVQIEKAQAIMAEVVTDRRQTFYNMLESYKGQPGNEVLWSAEHLNGWDAALRAVTGNAAYAQMPLDRQIALAHDMYAANVKAMTGKAIVGAKAADQPQGEQTNRRTDPRPDPVQTLAGFNTDTSAAMDDGTFSAIDRMFMSDPDRAEQMLARLSPEQQAEFLAKA